MPGILTWKTKDEIPEEFREHAEEKDGVFACSVVSNKRHREVADNNILYRRQAEEAAATAAALKAIVGEDAEKFKGELAEMRDIHQQVKDGKIKGSTAIEAEVQDRLKTAKVGYDEQNRQLVAKVTAAEAKSAGWEGRYKRLALHQELTGAVMSKESGALPEALPDILACGDADWKIDSETGKPVRMNGDVKVYGADGDPMTPKEWLAGLLKQKPYFAKGSAGGGATGARDGVRNGGMSNEAFQKLPPAERIKIARQQRNS